LIIGVFNPALYRIGGGELVTINMIDALKKQGHKVIVSANKKIDNTKIFDAFGKNVTMDAQVIFPFHFRPPYIPSIPDTYTTILQSSILKLKCDIFIDTYSFIPFPWANVTYFQGTKFFHTFSDSSFKKIYSRVCLLPYRAFLKSIKNLDQKILFANSKFSAEILKKQFPFKDASFHILYPPVESNFFDPCLLTHGKFRDNVVIAFSRIAPEKRLEVVPLIASLTDEGISFIIAGSCQSPKTLYLIQRTIKKLKVSDRVKVLTNISRENLRTLLWSSKVYLHTAKNEPFGVSIVEAMSSGCMAVVHDSGGPKEFVPKYLRYKSMEEAAMKIERAISEWSPECAERMLNIAKRFDEQKFCKEFLDKLNPHLTRN